MSTSSRQSGFTLVEVIVVVAIIGLLSSLAMVSFARQQARSREARRISDIQTISDAIQQYTALGNAAPYSPTSGTPPSGNWRSTSSGVLDVLVSSGIVARIPTEQNPQGSRERCRVYYYAATVDLGNVPDTSGQPIGLREYGLSFHSELATAPPNTHPMNNNLITLGDKEVDCPYYSVFLLAAKQQ